jgi:hypothetical protein
VTTSVGPFATSSTRHAVMLGLKTTSIFGGSSPDTTSFPMSVIVTTPVATTQRGGPEYSERLPLVEI